MRVFQWNERALLASGKIFFCFKVQWGPGGFLPWHPDGVVKPTSRASKPAGVVGLQGCS